MASLPPAEGEPGYDPRNDPTRKAGSKDPGWKYGYMADRRNRNSVTCNLCGIVVNGGIKRLKQHLAGGYGDAKICRSPQLTTEIRREMRDYLEQNKKTARPLDLDDGDDGNEVIDSDVEVVEVRPAAQVRPSSGTAAKQRRTLFQFKKSAATNGSPKTPKVTKSVVAMLRKSPEEIVQQRAEGGKNQKTMESTTKTKEEKLYVDIQWALWFYEAGIPFNAAASRQFQIAVEATLQYGVGYIPPNPHAIGDPLLWNCANMTSSMREDHEKAWKHYGCTLMSDGWSDRRGHHLINFLVNSPEGTYFLESVDASNEVQDAEMLADLLEKRIEDIGRDNVVQVITDNGANYKAAGKLLMERIPVLFWSPCAAHCLDLMLEDIGNLKEFSKCITHGKRITTFIYRHGRVLSAMREKTSGRDLIRPGATRFATSFLTLKSLYKHKDALKVLFNSEEWVGNKLSKTAAGEHVRGIVFSTEFWSSVEDCLRASAPLLIVLRVVDGDEKPAMPEVAALMDHAKEKIKLGFATQNRKRVLKSIMDIIERRWVRQMDHPLYGAALYLNPGKLFPLIDADNDAYVGQLRGSFLDVLDRMVEDENLRDIINGQAMDYESHRGAAFSNRMAMQNIVSMNPLDWWRSYGGRAIEIQRFARRVVSLCASSSGCERNWSTFEFIHTKKRNRLLHKRLNAIVFISYNRKMKTRFQVRREKKGKSFDPLVVEDFDWDNEWADSFHVPPQGARGDLTWELVDEAMGASSSLQGRNLPRRAHRNSQGDVLTYKRARNYIPPVQGDEMGSANEEDEEEDPYDDADVTDCEGGDNGNNAGEDMDAAALDEFDDGY